jgi:DNA-binding winged helix-turn-helix (wHTH) protein
MVLLIGLIGSQSVWFYHARQSEMKNIQSQATDLFFESLEEELSLRLEGTKENYTNFAERRGIISDEFFDIQEAVAAKNMTFDISRADSLYRSYLLKNQLAIPYQIIYSNKEGKIIATTGHPVTKGFKTDQVRLTNETNVQAIIHIPLPVIIYKMRKVLISMLLFVLGVCPIYWSRFFSKFVKKSDDVAAKEIVALGTYTFNLRKRTLQRNGNICKLTPFGFEILRELYHHKGKIVERKILLKTIWEKDDAFTSRSLDVFLTTLRKYFSDDPNVRIESFRNKGIRLTIPA